MQTTFTLQFTGESEKESAGLAQVGLDHLEYLESKLSRYREGSDIWQINHMKDGDELFVSEDCHQCLLAAVRASTETKGHFDVTIGSLIEEAKHGRSKPVSPLKGRLRVEPDRPLVICEAAGREIDLGGIGKGFALDQIKALLIDWGVSNAFLSAGASTHLAVGEKTYPIELTGNGTTKQIELKHNAISASGISFQGVHIVSPYQNNRDKSPFKRVWAVHPEAALADAWSTALLLFKPGELSIHELKPTACFGLSDSGIVRLT